MRCLYEVLEVARDAEAGDIKTAYRKAALRWHPGELWRRLEGGKSWNREREREKTSLDQSMAGRPLFLLSHDLFFNLFFFSLPSPLKTRTRTTRTAPRPASRRSRTPTRSSRTGRSAAGMTTTETRSSEEEAREMEALLRAPTKQAATALAAGSPRTRTSTSSPTSRRRASPGTAAVTTRKGSTRSTRTCLPVWRRTS